MNYRDHLEFRGIASVGQLVFKYDASAYEWRPYWVVDVDDGMCELRSAYGDERIEGVPVAMLGTAVGVKI
jgi:hypothetical protein